MGKRLLSFILLLLATSESLFILGCNSNQEMAAGDCSYKDYNGIVTIKSIETDPKSSDNLGVNYMFEAEDSNTISQVKRIPGTITLPKQIIEQKGIKAGKQFHTKASYIEKGSCEPGPTLDNFYNWQ